MHKHFPWILASIFACGDGETGISAGRSPSIEVREGDQLLVHTSTIAIADGTPRTIRVSNTGDADLVLRGVTLSAEPATAFALIANPTPTSQTPVTLAPRAEPWTLTLTYDASQVPQGTRARATITIATNPTVPDGLESFVLHVTPERVVSKLVLQPSLLDFSTVRPGTAAIKPLNVLNTGAVGLEINRVELVGDPGYSATVEGQVIRSGGELVFTPPLVLSPSSARQVDVAFHAPSAVAARAELVFHSSDPAATGGTRAALVANLAGPCLRAIPPRLDFGGKPPGSPATLPLELESCGDREVTVSAVELADDGGGLFSLDLAGLAFPLTIPPGERRALSATYFPEVSAPFGTDGQPVRDTGRLQITSNAYLVEVEVELSGFGSGCCCPVAIIEVAEGPEVTVQTELHLSGALSSAPQGNITRWQWSVLQPNGSLSQFFPSAESPTPTFRPNLIGTYIFRLDVYDSQGQKSCAPAEYLVEVTSPDAIHVELLWRTPGDPDESDEGSSPTSSAGSDVDLHFLHPFAVRYFDVVYDCYWLTPQLEWLPPGPEGNPRLDRDDRDGGGPENLNMTTPEPGSTYRVGVHYYNDWGYGDAFATIRIYIHGVLRDQWADVRLTNADLWQSHTIEWPSTTLTRSTLPDGTPDITPGYPTR